MAYKTKYQLMDASSVTDNDGNYYPDLATFPINEIRITERPSDYQLTYNDLYRFFDLCYDYYGSFDLYDYLTLWLNDITNIGEMYKIYENNEEKEINTYLDKIIKFYGKKDIDDWYIEKMKSTD